MKKDIKVIIIVLIGLLAVYGYFKNIDELNRNDIILKNTNQTLENNKIMSDTLNKIDSVLNIQNDTLSTQNLSLDNQRESLNQIQSITHKQIVGQDKLNKLIDNVSKILSGQERERKLANITASQFVDTFKTHVKQTDELSRFNGTFLEDTYRVYHQSNQTNNTVQKILDNQVMIISLLEELLND